MNKPGIAAVVIDPAVAGHPRTREIVGRLPPEISCSEKNMTDCLREINNSPDPVGAGKRMLYVSRRPGRKVVACPGTSAHLCCGYQIISPLSGCPLDCSYCILQAYYRRQPLLQYDVDHEALIAELRGALETSNHIRWGTGEFSDSLALEPLLQFHREIVATVLSAPGRVIEVKSKADVDLALLPADPRVIIGLSLNVNEIITTEERGTASQASRLHVADRAVAAGFSLAFHFDPVIDRGELIDEYCSLLHSLTERYPLEQVAYISLGTLRFSPELAPIIRRRFPGSRLLEADFIRGDDGKWRYPEERRRIIYQKMVENLSLKWKNKIYLCMETAAITEQVFGDVYNLPRRLDECVRARAG